MTDTSEVIGKFAKGKLPKTSVGNSNTLMLHSSFNVAIHIGMSAEKLLT